MRALSAVLIAMTAYAMGNVIIARKLADVSALAMIPIYTFAIAVLVFVVAKSWSALGGHLNPAGGHHVPWIALLIVLFVIADIAYVSAFNFGDASLATITTCVALMPIMAVVLDKVFFQGTLPSMRTLCGVGLMLFTVWLVAFDPANAPLKH